MKRFVLSLLLAMGVATPAYAKVRPIAPPGNSAISQYTESIPTVKGNRPTSNIQVSPGNPGGPGATAGGATSAGASGSAGVSGRGSAPAGGTNGRAAAALARATAPGSPRLQRKLATGVGNGASPVSSLLRAFTGSTGGGGGLGPLLPVILIVAVLGATALVVIRRRRTS